MCVQVSRLDELWASERDAERECYTSRSELEVALSRSSALEEQLKELPMEHAKEVERLRVEVERLRAEVERLRAVVQPKESVFIIKRAFAPPVDLAIIECLVAGVARRKVPGLFITFARLFGITIPTRMRRVPGKWVDGKRQVVERTLLCIPGATHCKQMAGVMYQLNKLQVCIHTSFIHAYNVHTYMYAPSHRWVSG
jgi:hypothetical protein